MKKMTMAVLAWILVLGSFLRNDVSAQYYDGYNDRDRDLTYQDFYDELSPYGRWVEYPGQGYVWVPDAGDDFQPYSTRGHWVWTDDYEWMWVSDYDWGWAPFHYGRWDYDDYYGWYWVPGYEWSPAWVAWRDGGDYYGWAPIRPGISISIHFNIGGYNPPFNFWCFAPRRYINSPRIYDYYVDRRQNVTIIHQTTIIVNNFRYSNNYGFRSGPRRYDAEIYCGRINPVRFRQTYAPGRAFYRDNEVNMYRPSVRQDNNRGFAPRQFERYDRNSGGFRNNNGYNRNNEGYNNRNNDRNFRRDDGGNNRSGGRPDDRDRVDNNRSFDRRKDNFPGRNRDNPGGFRRDESTRQPNTEINRPNDRGRFDRNDNNPGRLPEERRVDRPGNRPDRSFEPRDNRPTRDPSVQPQPDNGRFDRRNADNNPGRNREVRTDDTWRQRQPQQMERRQEPRPQPQVERSQEQPRQRSFERRSHDGGDRQRDGGSNGGGNGGGRGRRF